MMVDSGISYQNYRNLEGHCLSCNSSEHLLKGCPFLLYAPTKDTIIQKYEFSVPRIDRITFHRKRKEKTQDAYKSFQSLKRLVINVIKKSGNDKSRQELLTDESDAFSDGSDESFHESKLFIIFLLFFFKLFHYDLKKESSRSEFKNQSTLNDDLLPEPIHVSPPTLHPDLLKVRKDNKDLLSTSSPQKRMSLSNQPTRRFSAMANDNLKRSSIQDNVKPHLDVGGQAQVAFRRSSVQQVVNEGFFFF
jgi:hypothetical protein